MRHKLLLAIAASSVAVLGACSSDQGTTAVAASTTYVAPLVDYGATVDTALWFDGFYDPFTGVAIAQVTPPPIDAGIEGGIEAGIEAGIDGGVDAGLEAGVDAGAIDRGTITRLFPRPLSGLLAGWRAVVNASCVPMVATVDADQDGVPASYSANWNCTNQTVGDRTSSVTGTIAITDADDMMKLSGFTVTFTNFNVTTASGGVSRSRTLNGTASLMPTGTGSFVSMTNLTVTFDFTDQGNVRSQGTDTIMGQGTYTPDASVGSDVFAAGTVDLAGTSTLNRTIAGVAQSRVVTRTTNPALHWNRSCRNTNQDSLGYDAGRLVFQDDHGSRLELLFNGCATASVTTSG